MRVVVTGGSGKAGQWVVRAVADAGHEVVNLDRIPRDDLPGGFCRVELTDAGAVYDALFQVRPDAVCHLAANPSPSGQAQVDVFANNVLSAYHLMQAAGDAGARRVIYASSEMATGLLTEGVMPSRIPFDEAERLPSPNAYAISKYMSEVIADGLSRRYSRTAFVGLRINNVIPPDGYERFRREWEDPRLSMANFWSYIDARDVATAFLAAVLGRTTGHEVFLIAAADTSSDRPLPELMALCYPGYAGLAPDHPPFASVFSGGKIRQMLGWEPAHSWREQK